MSEKKPGTGDLGLGTGKSKIGTGDLGLGIGKKKIGTGVSGLGTRAQSPEPSPNAVTNAPDATNIASGATGIAGGATAPSPHAASAAGGRPDDVQEEEKWLFDLFEGYKNHFLLSPQEKEEIVQQLLEKLRQGQ